MESNPSPTAAGFPGGAVVFDIARFMAEDGPGIRTNIFFKGCPLRCEWCSNPFGLARLPEIAYNRRKCTLCGTCERVCPVGACRVTKDRVATDRALCTGCGRCAEACPTGARTLVGRLYSAKEIVDKVLEDQIFSRRTSGGVTLSGGEVLLQPEIARETLALAQSQMINTAIETSAYGPWRVLTGLLPFCNLVLVDLKHIDPREHRRLTGVSNKRILENIRRLGRYSLDHGGSPRVIVRLPVVPGLNDSRETMHQTAAFLDETPGVNEVNILPFHPFGIDKYEMVDRTYRLSRDMRADYSVLREYCRTIETVASRMTCSIGGANIGD